jgi:hypothetical protein
VLLPLKRSNINKRDVFLFVEYRTMDKVQKLNNSECYTPSSEPFRMNYKTHTDLLMGQPRAFRGGGGRQDFQRARSMNFVYKFTSKPFKAIFIGCHTIFRIQ